MFTKKLWIKFNENLDIECFCEENRKKCPPEQRSACREYIVKFIEIERPKEYEERINNIKDATQQLEARIKKETKKFETQLQKSLRVVKKFKI